MALPHPNIYGILSYADDEGDDSEDYNLLVYCRELHISDLGDGSEASIKTEEEDEQGNFRSAYGSFSTNDISSGQPNFEFLVKSPTKPTVQDFMDTQNGDPIPWYYKTFSDHCCLVFTFDFGDYENLANSVGQTIDIHLTVGNDLFVLYMTNSGEEDNYGYRHYEIDLVLEKNGEYVGDDQLWEEEEYSTGKISLAYSLTANYEWEEEMLDEISKIAAEPSTLIGSRVSISLLTDDYSMEMFEMDGPVTWCEEVSELSIVSNIDVALDGEFVAGGVNGVNENGGHADLNVHLFSTLNKDSNFAACGTAFKAAQQV